MIQLPICMLQKASYFIYRHAKQLYCFWSLPKNKIVIIQTRPRINYTKQNVFYVIIDDILYNVYIAISRCFGLI